jgi:hypothetical protein|nr:MAG TPA: hypothetical protein [Caudoviricetes sp.]
MITKPAKHRVQDLGSFLKKEYEQAELRGDISAYIELQQMQLDAQEDGDMSLSAALGRSMRQIREKYNQNVWNKEINLTQETGY